MFRTTYSSFRHIWIGFSPRDAVCFSFLFFSLLSSVHWLRVRSCFFVLLFCSFSLCFIIIILCVFNSFVRSFHCVLRAALRFPRIWPRSMMCKYVYTHYTHIEMKRSFQSVCSVPIGCSFLIWVILLIFLLVSYVLTACRCVRVYIAKIRHGRRRVRA